MLSNITCLFSMRRPKEIGDFEKPLTKLKNDEFYSSLTNETADIELTKKIIQEIFLITVQE